MNSKLFYFSLGGVSRGKKARNGMDGLFDLYKEYEIVALIFQ
jgi:hypothetical protein